MNLPSAADLAAIPARWARWLIAKATHRRRMLNQRLLEWPAILRAASSDRGQCGHCGEDHALKRDGRIRSHNGCPGGDELPAPLMLAHEATEVTA